MIDTKRPTWNPSDHVKWVALKDSAEELPRKYPSAALWTIEQAFSWVVNNGQEPKISTFPLTTILMAARLYSGKSAELSPAINLLAVRVNSGKLVDAAKSLLGKLCSGDLVAKRVGDGVSSVIEKDTWRVAESISVLASFAACYVEAADLKRLFPAKRGRPRGGPASAEAIAEMKICIAKLLDDQPGLGVNNAWRGYKEKFGDKRLPKDKHFQPTFLEMKKVSLSS
jgi:hypothetical protein